MRVTVSRRIVILATATCTLGAASAVLATTALADTVPASPRAAAMTPVADELQSATRSGADALASIAIDDTNHAVDVWTKGRPSPQLAAKAKAVSGKAAVRLHQARYSEDEMNAAANALIDAFSGRPGPQSPVPGVVVTNVEHRPDGSGVAVTYTASEPGTNADQVRTALQLTTAVPVTAVTETAAAPQPTSRWNDRPDYYGGAAFNSNSGSCTTGFAVLTYSSRFMLSSAHCYTSGGNLTNGSGSLLATADNIAINMNWDSMLINTEGDTAGRVYVGDYGTSANRRVTGTTSNYVNKIVCTEGAMSGEHCNLKVGAKTTSNVQGYKVPMWSAVAKDSVSAVANARGDSGGPVVTLESDGTALAAGIITLGETAVRCLATNASTTCYHIVYYTDINSVLGAWGGTSILTG